MTKTHKRRILKKLTVVTEIAGQMIEMNANGKRRKRQSEREVEIVTVRKTGPRMKREKQKGLRIDVEEDAKGAAAAEDLFPLATVTIPLVILREVLGQLFMGDIN